MLDHWLSLLQEKSIGDGDVLIGNAASSSSVESQGSKINGQINKDKIRETGLRVILQILCEVEHVPLQIQDMRTLRSSISEYLQVYGLQDEKELIKALQYRFSLDFLPGISSLGLQTYSKYVPEITLQVMTASDDKESSEVKTSPLPVKANDRPWANKPYLLCSIKRVQSALSTVFRMYIDGIKEYDSNGELKCFHSYEGAQVFLYATKTLKSGLPSQSFLYNTLDSKLWKDKQAVGKLTKAGNIYTVLPLFPGHDNSLPPSPRGGAASANPSPPPLSSNLTRTSSGGEAEGPDGDGAGGVGVSEVSPAEEGGVLHRIVTAAPAPLALSVQKRGVEKLLLLSVSIPTPSTHATSSSAAPDCAALLPILEQALSSPPASTASHPPLITFLRSKLPHKGGGGFAIAFSKNSRVKTASRKNVVLEVIAGGRGDFSPDPDHLPVLQMGKMDEDTFAVDFYDLSPMQAFAIALSVFDR